jgi:predicted MPP superfamily phosphohydrolase
MGYLKKGCPRRRRLGGAATAALGAAAAALAYRAAWHEPRSLVCPEVPLALPGWPAELEGLRVALVADIHAGAGHGTPARVAAIVDAVLALDADVHLLLGDFLDSSPLGAGRARVRDVARELARIPRAVAVLGNHDWLGAGPAMGWALRDAGVRVLENEAVPMRDGLWVAGLADARHRFPDVDAALRDVPDDAAVLLAMHDPDCFPRVPARVALTAAGHTHGGQVNIPLLRRLALPSRFGERYLAGHVVERGRHLYVSSGLGTAGLPLRLRRPPELPMLRLTAAFVSGM